MQCDVLVVGGGSAGLAAALSSAKLGAKTCLIERHGMLGGMATAALVHSICGLYRFADGPEPIYANGGFGQRFAERLIAAGGATAPKRLGRVDVLFHQPAIFASVADELVREAENLEVRFHSEVVSADADLDAVDVCSRGSREIIHPRAVIDASGDGVVAALCGAEYEKETSERLQRAAFIVAFQGVASEAVDETGRLRLANVIAHAVHRGELPASALGTTFRFAGSNLFATINLDDPAYDPVDAGCLTRLEFAGRATARALADYLPRHLEAFSEGRVSAYPTRVGVRESRRIVGRTRLETADFLAGGSFHDEVAHISWPMELREKATQVRLVYPEGEKPCGIPLGVLRARDHERLFTAGRCISCSHEVQASIRVMGTCFATGEAAGFAAARYSRGESEPGAVAVNRDREDVWK